MLANQTNQAHQLAHPNVQKEIRVTVKSVYGVTKFYPECRNADLFASIASTKTLTNYTLQLIKMLGYKITVIQEEVRI